MKKNRNILYLDWPCFGSIDVVDALECMGYTVTKFFQNDFKERKSTAFMNIFEEIYKEEAFDFCFSYNFFPLLAECCHKHDLIYLSLVYDNPFVKLYSYTITYPTNYVFLFDYKLYEKLRGGGIPTVYYSPLPVDAGNIDILLSKPFDKKRVACDISFVGALYNEDHNLFDRMYQKLSPSTRGYLDGIMQAQLKISGYNFIEELLTPTVIADMQKAEPYVTNPDGVETAANIYADYYIGRKLTSMERIQLLTGVASKYDLKLFTLDPKSTIPKASNMGPADYYEEMPLIFHESKINLNITLRSIQSGIPLRGMDILGAGGFLLTNYQEDFLRHFVPGEDFVYYEDEKDLMEKIDYYLNHEDERCTIAENGHEKVRKNHSFEKCLTDILSIVFP